MLMETNNQIQYALAVIFNKSLQEGCVPKDFREANVSPLFKKGSRQVAGNYRPVSLTSVVGKLMESVIKDEVVTHLENNNILIPEQHGFRRGHSCITNLLSYMNTVTEMIDAGRFC